MLDCAQTAALLRSWDKILVMSHASPDGDTLGSASALLRGLASLGKEVAFFCADPVPEKFAFLFESLALGTFEPEHVMAVDVADKKLLGKNAPPEYLARAELAIDHHGTHVPFARERWVEPEAAATTEMIWALLGQLGVELAPAVADCLYTGLATDTGCFRYQNVTPRTLRIAADLLERGARAAEINRAKFESKSKAQVEAERRAREKKSRALGAGEVTLSEIWQELERMTALPPAEGMAAEREAEAALCRANPYFLPVVAELRRMGKELALLSDMYLPGEFLQQLVEQAGFARSF